MKFFIELGGVYSQVETVKNLNFVCYYLSDLLRTELLEKKMYVVSVKSGFDLTSLQGHTQVSMSLSEKGRSHVDEIISIVFGGIETVNQKYMNAKYFKEFQKIAKTQFYMEPKPVDWFEKTQEINDYWLELGAGYAFSRGKIYKAYNQKIIDRLFESLQMKNLFIGISDNFPLLAKVNSGKESFYKKWNLEKRLSEMIGKRFELNGFVKNSSNVKQEPLDQFHTNYSTFYHFQKIGKKLQEKLLKMSKSIVFNEYKMNEFIPNKAY